MSCLRRGKIIEMNNIFELVTYFAIYSFLGWVMESIVRTIAEKKIINTGFLYGPFCPIYGCGAIIMIVLLCNFADNWLVLFLASFVILTLWEYVVGVLLEKIFKTKYWDYSDQKFNFQGRICLTNSLCWGVLGVLFIYYIHPFIEMLIGYIDSFSLKVVVLAFILIFLIDFIVSVIKVKNIKTTLEKIESLNQQIKEKLQEMKKNEKLNKSDKLSKADNVQLIVEELKKKRDRILRRLYRRVYRLKKAFPAINTKEIAEVLNKKIELRKKEIKK